MVDRRKLCVEESPYAECVVGTFYSMFERGASLVTAGGRRAVEDKSGFEAFPFCPYCGKANT